MDRPVPESRPVSQSLPCSTPQCGIHHRIFLPLTNELPSHRVESGNRHFSQHMHWLMLLHLWSHFNFHQFLGKKNMFWLVVLTILTNINISQWLADDIPYMKWKIIQPCSSHQQPVFYHKFLSDICWKKTTFTSPGEVLHRQDGHIRTSAKVLRLGPLPTATCRRHLAVWSPVWMMLV